MLSVYDALEVRAPEQREAELLSALPVQVAHAQTHSAAFADILKGVDAASVTSRAALALLPVTRKHDLQARQQAGRARVSGADRLGGFSTVAQGATMPKVFASPGPIYEPEGTTRDYWRLARALFATGFRPGELIHNSLATTLCRLDR